MSHLHLKTKSRAGDVAQPVEHSSGMPAATLRATLVSHKSQVVEQPCHLNTEALRGAGGSEVQKSSSAKAC